MERKSIILAAACLGFVILWSGCKESPRAYPWDMFSMVYSASMASPYPESINTIPQTGDTEVPINSTFVIIFSIPVNAATFPANIAVSRRPTGSGLPFAALVQGVDYTIAPGAGATTTATITFSYGGANPLLANDDVRVIIGTGITDMSVPPQNLPAAVTVNFSTTDAVDATAPTVNSTVPADTATNIPLNQGTNAVPITITFDAPADIDPSSLNTNNIYLQRVSDGVIIATDNDPTVNAALYNVGTNTATIHLADPATDLLDPDESYDLVITGVKDVSGNTMAGTYTATFSTVAHTALNVSITEDLEVTSVDNTNAFLVWATSDPAITTFHYRRGDNPHPGGTAYAEATVTAYHAVTLAGLTAGKRYWVEINQADYVDINSDPGTNSSPALGTLQFNTTTGEPNQPAVNTAGNQSTIYTQSQTSSTGSLVFWTDTTSGNSHLYGQRYTNVPARAWALGGIPIFSQAATSYTYLHAADDGAGGTVLLAATANNIYAKRVLTGGTIDNWNTLVLPTSATTAGYKVNGSAGGTLYGKAAAVYAGLARVLYAWEQGGSAIRTTIIDITEAVAGTPPTVDVAEIALSAGQRPFLVPDGSNNAIIAFTSAAGRLYGHLVDGDGRVYWGTPTFYNGTTLLSAVACAQVDSGYGSVDLSPGGHDWSGSWLTLNPPARFRINNGGVTHTIDLVNNCPTIGDVVTHINNQLDASYGGAGLSPFEAYDDGNFVGIRTKGYGSSACITLLNGIVNLTYDDALNGTFGSLGIPQIPALTCGNGVDWSATNESFTVNVDGLSAQTITLNARCTTIAAVIAHVDAQLAAAYIAAPYPYQMVRALNDGANHLRLETLSTGTRSLALGGADLGTFGIFAGTYSNGTAQALTGHANGESIIDMQSDRSGGAVILYRYGANNVFVQRVDSALAFPWGVNGYNPIAATVSSQEVMACINAPVDGVIVAANIGNVIWARRVGTSPWGGNNISAVINAEIQQNPQIFVNGVSGASALITWEDNRFFHTSASTGYAHNTGWGVFGMMINTAAPFTRNINWTANATGVGANNFNGVAVVLNNYQIATPKHRFARYSNTSQALLLWEDYRNSTGSDILYIDINSQFNPQ